MRHCRRARAGLRLAALYLGALAAAACADRSEPTLVRAAGVELRVSTQPASPRVGANQLWIEMRDAQGQPVEGARVDAKVHMHSMGAMPGMGGTLAVVEVGEGRYRAEYPLDMGGTWLVELAAQAPGAAEVAAQGSLKVGAPGVRLEVRGAPPATGSAASPAAGHAGHTGQTAPPVAPAPPGAHPAQVLVPAERLQRIGVRIADVRRERVSVRVRALGLVRYDESALHDVSLRVAGWARRVDADAVGEPVAEGDVLFTLYSPELYAAQAEYLGALRSQADARTGSAPDRADELVRAALARLRLAGVAAADLHAIASRGAPQEELPIRAPASGYVVEKAIVAGGRIEIGARLYRIAPLDRVWLEAELYESDLARVHEGQTVAIELPHAPGEKLAGRVARVLPRLDRDTRTARVRIELPNPGLRLRPDMYATVWLEADEGERLVVPDSAVLHAGERSFVFLERGEGRFEPREVALGLRAGDRIEVVSGLAEGDRVVASGTFLIASESRLRAALEQW
jgi:Cu(I)/Ag(I) efflux system membrane fusion protein